MKFEGLPDKMNPGIDGEIIEPHDEDPALARKFKELPEPVAQFYESMDREMRRMLFSDDDLIKMSQEELLEIFTFSNPQYQTLDQRTGIEKHLLDDSKYSSGLDTDPADFARDITPHTHPNKQLPINRKTREPE